MKGWFLMARSIDELTKEQRLHLCATYKRQEDARTVLQQCENEHLEAQLDLLKRGFTSKDLDKVIQETMSHFNKE